VLDGFWNYLNGTYFDNQRQIREVKILEMKMKKTFLLAVVLFILAACSSSNANIAGDWKLISYGDATNPMPAVPNVDTSIKFESNGQISGNVGCNGFGGNYEVTGDKITFNSIMSTMMYCEETSLQEQAVLSVFSDSMKLQFQMNGDTLTIISADGLSAVNLARK
jgi:heat shock protein HslJ